jgi:hypothetical protein
LNILTSYRSHGADKPSTLASTEGGFTPTASIVALGEDTDPQIGQPSCCELGREPFLLGLVALSIVVDDFTKCCYALTS